MKTDLKVRYVIDGYHHWPDAPDKYIEFRYKHRHLFIFEVEVLTGNTDDPQRREMELWELRDYCIHLTFTRFSGTETRMDPIDFGSRSCEGIAQDLLSFMTSRGYKIKSVGVYEEEGLGAVVSEDK